MCLSLEISRPGDVLGRGEHCGHEWRVIRNPIGFRCGYVKVAPGHPWHGVTAGELECEVHGGPTFAERDVACGAGGADDGYWIGFDCGHARDGIDAELQDAEYRRFRFFRDDRPIRTQAYVEAECRRLCEQAARFVRRGPGSME